MSDEIITRLPLAMNRFHVASVAFQRARQLHNGARPRVDDSARHKPTFLAVLEVWAQTVSWSMTEAPPS
jgi:DNA-directed RNA polymerase subunit K/omega